VTFSTGNFRPHWAVSVQEALVSALQMVSNSPDYGFADNEHREEAVVTLYDDTVWRWRLWSRADAL
jgi:hypothetical protein